LERRVWEHKTKQEKGFTAKYNCNKLVYFEETNDVSVAIEYEKKIKGGSRQKKIELIQKINPKWDDLSDGWFDEREIALRSLS